MRTIFITAACLILLAGAFAQQGTQTPTAMPSGKAVLEAYVSAWNRHDFAAFDKILAPGAVHEDIALGANAQGVAQIKDFMQKMIQGQPDLDWRVSRVVESGPVVVAEWTWSSTFTGEGPTGPVKAQRISGRGISIVLTENGQIKHFTDYYDLASFFPKAPTANTASSEANAKQQILDLEQTWVTAEHNHDVATLRHILDDKFVASFNADKPLDKEAFIKLIVTEAADPTESQTLTDRNVIIDQDTAVVVGVDNERGTKKGKAYTAVYRYTVTYVRRNGQWVALAEHLVEVPQTK